MIYEVQIPQSVKYPPYDMKGQSEIAYLPKFADLYVKLKLEFLIASPIPYILSFWSLL